MATNALIVFKNVDGIYNCISVHWDGYIDNGVGEILYKNWQNNEDIKTLCGLNKEIRCFDSTFDTIEFYADDPELFRRIKRMKNLTLDRVKNLSGNYSFTYIWEEDNPGWKVLLDGSLDWDLDLLEKMFA